MWWFQAKNFHEKSVSGLAWPTCWMNWAFNARKQSRFLVELLPYLQRKSKTLLKWSAYKGIPSLWSYLHQSEPSSIYLTLFPPRKFPRSIYRKVSKMHLEVHKSVVIKSLICILGHHLFSDNKPTQYLQHIPTLWFMSKGKMWNKWITKHHDCVQDTLCRNNMVSYYVT